MTALLIILALGGLIGWFLLFACVAAASSLTKQRDDFASMYIYGEDSDADPTYRRNRADRIIG